MKKRIISVFLSCLIALGACACSAKSPDTMSELPEPSETISAAVPPETPEVAESSRTESKNEPSENPESSVSPKKSESSAFQSSTVSEKNVSSNVSSESAVSSTTSQSQHASAPSDNTVTVTSYPDTSANTSSEVSSESPAPSESVQTQSDNEHWEDSETYNTDTEEVTEPEQNNDNPPDERTLPDKTGREKKIIVLDAGHQAYPDFDTEPIAPGSWEMKTKVTGGTTGVVTGIPEYELTLALALRLQEILEERGYEVVQTRTTNDINISNIERADVANNINADAFVRIHANGSDYSYVNGAMALCQTPYNPNNGHIYPECYSLSEHVLDELVASTGCNKQYIWETDTMCGINWSLVPVTIIEVGYMSNPQEDSLMATDEYREKICVGIANGLDRFFEEEANSDE